jgi:thiamine-phosphate pyrophosphorylase
VSRLPVPCVALVTDRRRLSPEARTTRDQVSALERWLVDAIEAGVDLIQLRERDLDAALLRDLSRRVAARARGTATRVLINDRADVAEAAGADGVHLRADGPPAARVRALHAGWVIGRSVHGVEEARGASEDYLLFGTVFASHSKPTGWVVGGLDGLREVVAASPVPVLGIGGIDPARARACAGAGAAGVAGISVFLPEGRAAGSLGVTRALEALRAAFASVQIHRALAFPPRPC